MKKNIFNPIFMLGLLAISLFSCAGTSERSNGTAMDQETFDEADVVGDEADLPVNQEVTYDDMFENVEDTENYDILSLARMEEDLSIFVELVELSGLAPSFELTGSAVEGKVTVLMPTDEAFKQMPEERYEYLTNPENRTELIRVIKMHILPTEVPYIMFDASQIVETQTENEIPVSTSMQGEVVYVGGARIVKPDINASNGIIHVVNGIIDPGEFTDVTAD